MAETSASVLYAQDFWEEGSSDSDAIRACMVRRKELGGCCTVVLNGRDWNLDEAVLIPSDTTVIVDGCTVRQNDLVFDNLFRGDNLILNPQDPWGAPLKVEKLVNVRILGRNGARLEGCKVNRHGWHPVFLEEQPMVGNDWGWRTILICLSRCDGFEVAGLSLFETRCWALSFDCCSNGDIHHLHIQSAVKNGDGVDIRIGCHHCRVSHITGVTSDDSVACTAILFQAGTFPVGHYLYPLEPAAVLLPPDDLRQRDIHHIDISDIRTGGSYHGVICLAAGGIQVYDISIRDVVEEAPGDREASVRIYTGYGTGYRDNDLHDILVENVTSRISQYGVYCTVKTDRVKLVNIQQLKPGGEKYHLEVPDGISIVEKDSCI